MGTDGRAHVQEELINTIVGRDEKAGPSYPVYVKCRECDTFTSLLQNQGCVECVVKTESKG